uniref:PDZ domain-containing protein n=2 Tax=Alexandrium catenella TaxID=2925 RepID=A0A7S1S482_ALECA
MGATCCTAEDKQTGEAVTVEQAQGKESPPEEPMAGSLQEPKEEQPNAVRVENDKTATREFTVVLQKLEPGDKVGAKVARANNALEVMEVKDGLLLDHNKKNPDEAVQKGDLIVEGNGKTGSNTILDVITHSDRITFKIQRRAPSKEVPPKNGS